MLLFDFQAIGNKLLFIRKRLGMTQSDVAAAAGLSDRTYADIERGCVNMRIETVMRICDALHITPDEILTQQPDHLNNMDTDRILARLEKCTQKQQNVAWELMRVYLDSLE